MKANNIKTKKPNSSAKASAISLGVVLLLLLSAGIFLRSKLSQHHRQAEVAAKGAQVMPFDLEKTTHIFEALPDGGLQTVTANNSADTSQIELIQSHLQVESAKFGSGDFSSPAFIHGDDMPGLSALKAGYQDMDVQYAALPAGASIRYTTQEPNLIEALNNWFEAQSSDHGHHAK